MFVVFEGIDGSGKTTVSNLVAKGLRARGIEIEHIREGGTYASSLVNRMREFGKDTRNLAMAPLAELLFYTAREAQTIAECLRPALLRGSLVIADRYLYSYEVLGRDGRGLADCQVRAIIDAVADGLWPDLVILMDVDPYVARARRQVSKLHKKAAGSESPGGSRKGLQGIGTQHLLREGYLALAAREPFRWVVMDNSDPEQPDGGLESVVTRLVDIIANRWELVDKRRGLSMSGSRGRPGTLSTPRPEMDFVVGREAFYRAVRARGIREQAVAAYFLAGLDDDQAWALREVWAQAAPDAVAYGLRGMGEPRAWALRRKLQEAATYYVARSLDGLAVEGPEAQAMREELVEREPAAVLATLDGNDTEAAWGLRERLMSTHDARVVASLKRLGSARAWAWRHRYWQAIGGTHAQDVIALAPLVDSLRGLDDDEAWHIRKRYLDLVPIAVLGSLADIESERAWELRERFVDQAAKIVLRTFDGSMHERAWALREAYAPRNKEALGSMSGLDAPVAWTIRQQCRDIWPSSMVKSLGPLGLGGRGRALALEALERHPDNISLLKHITRLCTMEAAMRPTEV